MGNQEKGQVHQRHSNGIFHDVLTIGLLYCMMKISRWLVLCKDVSHKAQSPQVIVDEVSR